MSARARFTAAELLEVSERLEADGLTELEEPGAASGMAYSLRVAAGLRGLEGVRILRRRRARSRKRPMAKRRRTA